MARKKVRGGNKWFWAVALVLVGAGAAFALSGGKAGISQDEKKSAEETQLGGGEESNQIVSQTSDFSSATKTKEISGEYYSLQNIRIGLHDTYERVVFDLGGGTKSPGYKVSISGNQIEVLLYDTLNRDANYQPTYIGSTTVAGQGEIIKSVEMFPTYDDSMIGFKINLTKSSSFRVVEFTNPARIAVDVQK